MDIQNNDYIYSLIVKSLTDSISDEESDILAEWLACDSENRQEYGYCKQIWEASKTMAFPQAVDVDEAFEKVLGRKSKTAKSRNLFFIIGQAAAILVIALLFSAIYLKVFKSEIQNEPYFPGDNQVFMSVTARHETYTKIELPDSSSVFLNAGSTLHFPVSFNGQKTRHVDLCGEGYFIVHKNENQPFTVGLKDSMQINVTGTCFNVDAYPENPVFTIALVEGSIELKHKKNNKEQILLNLEPNQICQYNSNEKNPVIKKGINIDKYIAWTRGELFFDNDNIETVSNKIRNLYNVDIEIGDKKIESYRFTGTFINETLEQVLSILSRTSNMSYTIQPAQKDESQLYSKRKVILRIQP